MKVRMSSSALAELEGCEYGSFEDHVGRDGKREPPYDKGRLHIVELIQRSPFKTVVELRSQAEIEEFFSQACTGTFGLHCTKACQRVWDQLAPLVSESVRAKVPRGMIGY